MSKYHSRQRDQGKELEKSTMRPKREQELLRNKKKLGRECVRKVLSYRQQTQALLLNTNVNIGFGPLLYSLLADNS
jgi:hypothetical protein